MPMKQFTVTTTAKLILQTNKDRKSVTIYNHDDTDKSYISHTQAKCTTSDGFLIDTQRSISLVIPADTPERELWIIGDAEHTVSVYESIKGWEKKL